MGLEQVLGEYGQVADVDPLPIEVEAQIARDLRPVYTAATEAEARARFAEFAEKWGRLGGVGGGPGAAPPGSRVLGVSLRTIRY